MRACPALSQNGGWQEELETQRNSPQHVASLLGEAQHLNTDFRVYEEPAIDPQRAVVYRMA